MFIFEIEIGIGIAIENKMLWQRIRSLSALIWLRLRPRGGFCEFCAEFFTGLGLQIQDFTNILSNFMH